MHFCPQCDNIMDIGKSIPKVNNLLNQAPTTVSTSSVSQNTQIDINDKVDKIINLYKNKETFDKDILTKNNIDTEQITTHPNFIKLKEVDRLKLLKMLNIENLDDSKIAYLICRNCFYHEKLTKKTLILNRMNLNTNNSSNINLNKYKYMIHDKTLPHTRDYICKNKDCVSHKDFTKRAAVWFRPIATSYSTYYGCTACSTIWNIS